MKNKKSLIAITSLMLIVLVGGSIAYYNQSIAIDNKLKTTSYKTEIVEKFTPDYDWQPGQRVTKEVGVENTGTGSIVARAKWEETWSNGAKVTSSDPSSSVVAKEYGQKWIYHEDGYYYYDGVILAGGKSEDKFINSITLSESVDIANTSETVIYYSTMNDTPTTITNDPKTGWVIAPNGIIPDDATYNKTIVTGTGDYAGANYTLTITVEVYQANKNAVAKTNFETAVPNTFAKME